MIKTVWNVIKKIFGFIFLILSPLKRLICKRKRRTSDTILPLANHYTIPEDFTQVPSDSQNEFQAWDSWGVDSQTSKVSQQGNIYHGNKHSRPRTSSNQEPEPEPDIDYFQDMAPDIKKQKRILVRKKQEMNANAANKFAVSSDVPLSAVPGGELGTWDDKGSAWDTVAEEDLSWQAEAALKEKRRAERQERNLEQQKRKQEMKSAKKDGQFSAVKLS